KSSRDASIACHVTIASVRETPVEDVLMWTIRFQRGDHSDKPRLLAARPGLPHGDYVSEPLRALPGTQEEVSSAAHAKFVAVAQERRPEILAEQKRRLEA